jgi:hypothetical protein
MSVIAAIHSPVRLPVRSPIVNRWGATPADLFRQGEQGAWYDPSDFSTMFQDSAGSTPVTGTGQPVGRINDKSGRGNNATQGTAAARPVLQQDGNGLYYLDFDGTDDELATAAIDFSATDEMTVIAGVRKLSDVSYGTIVSGYADINGTTGNFALFTRVSGGGGYTSWSKGTSQSQTTSAYTFTAPLTNVLTMLADISGDSNQLRINGTVADTSIGDQGTGNYGNHTIGIGYGAASFRVASRLYGIIVRGKTTDATQVAQVESWMNTKTGAY